MGDDVTYVALLLPSAFQSWCAVDPDGSRYLLSDFAGGLHLLVLAYVENRVAGLKVETLGERIDPR